MKKNLKSVKLLLFVVLLCCYCEFLMFYVVQFMCDWPRLSASNPDVKSVKAMLITDAHLLGPRNGHWLDQLRREWRMQRAFQSALQLHRPEVIFILGDTFEEGLWSSEEQFNEYLRRYKLLFHVPPETQVHVVTGNHDVGFHYEINALIFRKFSEQFQPEPVSLVTIRDVHFVLINSIAMEGDGCDLCLKAETQLRNISAHLNCAIRIGKCESVSAVKRYSRPVLLQHFPLYRPSDVSCNEWDSATYPEKAVKFREKIDCLSPNSTALLKEHLRFRVAWSGHTHHGCVYKHQDAVEYTVASFSGRNRNDPSYILAEFTPDDYAVYTCAVPKESSVIFFYILGAIFSLLVIFPQKRFQLKLKLLQL